MSQLSQAAEIVDRMPNSPESASMGQSTVKNDPIIEQNPNPTTSTSFMFPQSQEYQQKYMKTALQRHCAFYDRNCDGIISLTDTFRSLRALGFNLVLSLVGTLLIHFTMSYQTSPTWIPSIWMPIYLDRINRCQHGSTTKAYDFIGNVVSYPAVENVFFQFDPKKQGGLNYFQLIWMLWNLRDSFDPFGWILSAFWWTGLYILASNKGILSFQTMIAQYDGTLFYLIEQQRKLKKHS